MTGAKSSLVQVLDFRAMPPAPIWGCWMEVS
jgi:hypothetical protein